MIIKAFIFDLDGVICHTDELHYIAWKQVSDELGLKFNRDVNEHLRGISRQESFEIILRHNGIELSKQSMQAAIDRKNLLYREQLMHLAPSDIEPDVCPVLSKLRSKNIKLALGSSSRNAQLILNRLDIADSFDSIVDGTMLSRSKPDPEAFLKAAYMLNVPPSQCVVIEDAISGIEAALAAGMKFIAYRLHDSNLPINTMHAENFTQILDLASSRFSFEMK